MNIAPVVLAAILASIVASGLLVGGVSLLTRARALDATARHTLWFGTLIAIALLPLAGIATSVLHAVSPAGVAVRSAAANHGEPRPATVNSRVATRGSGVSAKTPATVAPASSSSALDPIRFDRLLGAISAGTAAAILGVLVLGGLAGFVGLIVSLTRLQGVKRRSSPLDESLSSDLPWLTAARSGRETYLRLSYEIETPIALGFGRPVILIPTDLATHSGLVAIEDLVVHEHAHLRRYDDYTNLVQRAIERIFWFNPFVWVVGRRIALEREIAADDFVVSRTSDSARYAEALWRLAREMRMPAHTLVAPGALFTRKQISVRIEALLAPGRASLRGLSPTTSAAAFAAALVSFSIVALAAPPLESAIPQQQARMAWTPAWTAEQTHANTDSMQPLSDLISTKLSSVAAAVEKPSANPSTQRIAELQTETSLLAAKLAVMKRIALKADSAKSQQRVAALQNQANELTARLDTLAARHATAVAQHVEVPAQQVDVPAVHVNVPAKHVDVPAVHVNVPAVNVNVPAKHVDVPGVRVDVPAVHVNVPEQRVDVPGMPGIDVPPVHVNVPAIRVEVPAKRVAMFGKGGSPSDDIAITRALIAHCSGCDLSGRDLRNLDLHGLTFSGVDLHKADLRGANLSHANLSGSDLSNANLDGADLTDTLFSGADISGASFRGARMDGVQFSGISLSHANFDPAALRAVLVHGCSGCDLSHMDLRGVDFHGVELSGADLSHSDLTGANLNSAKFSGVSFDRAKLDRADLRNAFLSGCSLSGTSLNGALLDGIRLSGTSLGRDP